MATTTVQTVTEPGTISIQSEATARKDVDTTLNFHKDNEDGSPPEPTYVNKPQTYERPVDTHNVTIEDIRGRETDFSINIQGFQFHSHISQEKDFLDENRIKEVYYPETEQLLKDVTGGKRVFIFDHTIRRDDANAQKDGDKSRPLRGPVQRVHIDQTSSAARSRVPFHLPDDADRLSKSRFQLINVWRPIEPILRDPLAVADSRTVRDGDLVAIPLIYPDRSGETSAVRYSKEQRFYYKSGLTPEEVILIKCFDSEDGLRVPHSAFVDPGAKEGQKARKSIEVRALVFHTE